MIRRILAFLLAGAVVLGMGLASFADDPDPDPPLRLKKKKKADDVKVEPGKPDAGKTEPAKEPEKEPEKLKGKEKPKGKGEDDQLVPEDGRPAEPLEDEKELLDRIGRNMRAVEEKLANKEVGEPTRQRQDDVLRDLDALIKKSEQPPPQGGGGGGGGGENDQQPMGGGGGGGAQQQRGGGAGAGGKQGGGSSGQSSRRQARRSGRRSGGTSMARGSGSGGSGQSPSNTGAGNTGGGGGTSAPRKNDPKFDEYKDVWGHLPESLRAEMNAYSNPAPFMPKYDDLIKKYYRTIAEQGRRKGD